MKEVGGACPLQGIMPTGKGTPGQEARVFLAFYVLLHRDKGKMCIYALQELSKAWQVIWVFPDEPKNGSIDPNLRQPPWLVRTTIPMING